MRLTTLIALLFCNVVLASDNKGYYRFPTIRGDIIIFTAEGDLWKVKQQAGKLPGSPLIMGLSST